MWGERGLPTLLVAMNIGAVTVDISVEVPQKTQSKTSRYSGYTTPPYVPEGF